MPDDKTLQIIEVRSQAKPAATFEINSPPWERGSVANSTCEVVAYFDFGVRIGICSNGTFSWPLKEQELDPDKLMHYLQRMRIFNDSLELLVWRSGEQFRQRLRCDGEGDSCDCIDVKQVLFGTGKTEVFKVGGQLYTEVVEDRGTRLQIPGSFDVPDYQFGKDEETSDDREAVPDRRRRIAIHTRNYLKRNSVGQATFYDCRFVAFTELF